MYIYAQSAPPIMSLTSDIERRIKKVSDELNHVRAHVVAGSGLIERVNDVEMQSATTTVVVNQITSLMQEKIAQILVALLQAILQANNSEDLYDALQRLLGPIATS